MLLVILVHRGVRLLLWHLCGFGIGIFYRTSLLPMLLLQLFKFWYYVLPLSFVSRYFLKFSFSFVLWCLDFSGVCCLLTSLSLWIFPHYSSYWLLILCHSLWKITWYDVRILSLLSLVLQANIWSILANVPCTLEKIVYSPDLRWNVLHRSVRSIWERIDDMKYFLVVFVQPIYCLKWGIDVIHLVLLCIVYFSFRSFSICLI